MAALPLAALGVGLTGLDLCGFETVLAALGRAGRTAGLPVLRATGLAFAGFFAAAFGRAGAFALETIGFNLLVTCTHPL